MVITGDYLMMVLVALAGFLTWLCSRRRNILLSLCAGLIWFSLMMWLFFNPMPPLALTEDYVRVLVWVFLALTFVPFVLYMNVPINRTKNGRSWTEYGEPPSDAKSSYQAYAEELHARMHSHRPKKARRRL